MRFRKKVWMDVPDGFSLSHQGVNFIAVSAHTDTVLRITEDGVLTGLPNRFEPAGFDIESLTLHVAGNSLSLPRCAREYFLAYTPYDLEVVSSWYHSEEITPHYIGLRIRPKRESFGFNLIFELATLKPIHFAVVTGLPSTTWRHMLDPKCAIKAESMIKSSTSHNKPLNSTTPATQASSDAPNRHAG